MEEAKFEVAIQSFYYLPILLLFLNRTANFKSEIFNSFYFKKYQVALSVFHFCFCLFFSYGSMVVDTKVFIPYIVIKYMSIISG